jgi:hypothetical protein
MAVYRLHGVEKVCPNELADHLKGEKQYKGSQPHQKPENAIGSGFGGTCHGPKVPNSARTRNSKGSVAADKGKTAMLPNSTS